jgi:nucleotide-binding universal stress UspA family protein
MAALAEVREAVEGYLKEKAKEGGANSPTSIAVLEGSIVHELHSYVEREKIDLVALTSHGTGGLHRWWRGSVAEGLLTAGGADLLMVQPWDETEEMTPGTARFARILVPLDGSEHSEGALARAQELADLFHADLLLVRVVPSPIELTSIYGVPGVEMVGESHLARIEHAEAYLDTIAAGLPEGRCETHVVEGPGAAEGIVESARDLGADLIVLAGHGRSGVERVILGSVADKVLRGTTRPVLVVRRGEKA